jgi:ankyrin repeat protein
MNITEAITSIQLLLDISHTFSEDKYLRNLGQVQAMEHLLKNLLRLRDGDDVNTKDNYGVTPLMWAAKAGHSEIARFLIRQGADVNAGQNPRQGENVLSTACQGGRDASPSSEGHTKIVKLLIENGLDLRSEWNAVVALNYALEYGGLEVAQLLLDKGVNINARDDAFKKTALIITMQESRAEVIRFLIDNGANVNAEDRSGTTALQLAAHWKRVDIVKLLLEKGAIVDAKAIAIAMNRKNDDITKLLHAAADKGPESTS